MRPHPVFPVAMVVAYLLCLAALAGMESKRDEEKALREFAKTCNDKGGIARRIDYVFQCVKAAPP